MKTTFPEFSNTSSPTPKTDYVPMSEVQSMVKKEVAKFGTMNTDSWTNMLVGLGGRADKSGQTAHGGVDITDDYTLTGLYMNEGLGGRIVDVIADDMTREWLDFDEDAPEKDVKTMNEEIDRLDVEEKLNEALRWQRLYGGAMIIVGAMDGQKPDKPLRENKIKRIEYLRVVDRTDIDITGSVFDVEPMSPTFGQVKVYKVNTYVNGQYIPLMIHASRCIILKNDPYPSSVRSYIDNNHRYWGMSSLQKVFESLRDLGGVNQSIVSLMYEFVVGKFKVAHLAEIMSQPGGESGIIRRMEIMNMSKSVLNAILIDSEEEYARDNANLAGVPEIIDRFMLMVTGATGIPVTRLFGRSPGGLNATGENDLRNYYDLIEAAQRNKLKGPLTRLFKLIGISNGIKEVPAFEFNSLYQMTELEYAELDQRKASTEQTKVNSFLTLVNMGALDADEVRHDYLGKTGSVKEEEEYTDPTEEKEYDPGGDPRKAPKDKDSKPTEKGGVRNYTEVEKGKTPELGGKPR